MRKIDKVEAATNVNGRNVCLLRDDELDAVSGGGKACSEGQQQYLKLELKTVYVSSY
jgi:hypothetical protein